MRDKARRWVRFGFLTWAVVSMSWLANSMRTRGVPDEILASSPTVVVSDTPETLELVPRAPGVRPALVFLCGSGVTAEAYAPMLRPIADAGYPVFIVKLPYRFAPLDAHKQDAIERAPHVIASHPGVVVAGHSLGGALACRVAQSRDERIDAMVLVGTTHPKEADLSSLTIPVTKVYASNDGVARADRVRANRHLLPASTKWVEIRGGNHSQFGNYGRQLFDGKPAITRQAQQEQTRAALFDALNSVTLHSGDAHGDRSDRKGVPAVQVTR